MNPSHADNSSLVASSAPIVPLVENPTHTSPEASSRTSSNGSESSRSHPLKSVKGWFLDWISDSESCSWLASGVTHLAIVIALSLIVITHRGSGPDWTLEGTATNELPQELDIELNQLPSVGDDLENESSAPTAMGIPDLQFGTTSVDITQPLIAPMATASVDALATEMVDIGNPLASAGGGLEGRNLENRRSIALSGGGSESSEAAVEAGLKWLAAHQLEDGSWSFLLDEEHCPQCAGKCRNPGVLDSSTGATGLALLCFLGAGYTQHEGPYQEVVANGLYFLINRMMLTPDGGDLRDVTELTLPFADRMSIRKRGDMYSHAIATLALSEDYAMTRDPNIAAPAQDAIDFIVSAQHALGGWRYEPRQPGDLSVTGWQLMALKSGVLGRLDIPRHVWYRAAEFLDSVEAEKGAAYGYQQPSTTRPAMSSVGLYGRMMIGWPQDHPPLLKGAAALAKEDPRKSNMYFNYYTSQVLHHVGGSGWRRWNPRMRNYLVQSQSDSGHENGSWYFDEAWSDRGGRLYTTTLAILTLEVYYRYMPMYQAEFVEEAP
ncbi:prenyltransferase/squalene oxidase repeat-containing protein [Bythopirellula polymerisocia]|uniref:Squalene cyclase C-terminal domain-containing protein n=1 Tax=Bythopirellula polymerisocia TaxID=2528003 RepID=A0A5C6CQM5_9BACT|nr:prenyltransferase/squalene oxidase repeat-containing protein [Bythopirellula polymerisocia]TWU25834.1 hypothetical protein Pla144_30460 [Bythopirellula polymerisocia]